jgi:integrase
MSLEYRSGVWNIVYYPQGRKGKKKRLTLPEDIQERADALIVHDEFLNRGRGKPSRFGLTVEKVWNDYLEWYEIHRAATTYKDVVNVGQWVKKYLGNVPAEDLNVNHIQLYQKMRLMGRAKPINRAVNKEVAYLGAFIKWAARSGYIAPRSIHVDKLPYKRPLPIILSPQEVMKIIEAAPPLYRAFFLCLYSLGLRSSEAKNLKWDNIDTENMSIMVKQKGGTFKTLPMSERLAAALKVIGPPVMGEYVFKSQRKGKAIVDVRKPLAAACLKAKITKHVILRAVKSNILSIIPPPFCQS